MKRKAKAKAKAKAGTDGDHEHEHTSPAPKELRKLPEVKLKDRALFLENGKTEGGRVKMGCNVIRTYWGKVDNGKGKRLKAPNINCRVETLGAIISEFGVVERQWVVEMGFGGLLYLAGKRQPRMLCYWLMTKLDPIRRLLVLNDNCRYQLLPQSVHWVLGLPCGGKKVPEVADTEVGNGIVESAFEKYGGYTSNGYRFICMKKVMPSVTKKHMQDENSNEFKLAFLIFVLGEFMCPSACSKLSHNLWPALAVYDAADEYDWCGYLLDNLMSAGRLFCQKFYGYGYAKGCGGCTYFLALFYIDHLDREPVSWGVFPRVKAWSNEAVNSVKVEDRLCDDEGVIIVKGDFGNLGCLNVAYGEQHPRAGRDTMGPTTVTAEVVRAVMSAMGSAAGIGGPQNTVVGRGVDVDPTQVFPSKVKRKVGPADFVNPRSRMASRKEPQPVKKTRRSDEVVVEDASEDEETPVGDDGAGHSPHCPQGNAGDDFLSTIVFSQDEFGAALNGGAALSQSSDSLFRNLFNDFVGGENQTGRRKDEEIPQDLGDGVVVQGEYAKGECHNGDDMVHDDKVGADNVSKEDDGYKKDETREADCNRQVDSNQGGCNKQDEECNRDRGNKDHEEEVESPAALNVGDSCSQKVLSPCRNKSRPKREKRATHSKEFLIEPFPRTNPNSRSRLIEFVLTTGALIVDSKNCKGMDHLNIFEVNIPMIQCNGMYADVMNCFSVVSPHCNGMDDNYIRTAGKLYTKMWKVKYEGRGVRYLMDPTFAMRIQQERGSPSTWTKTVLLCTSYAKSFPGHNVDSFNVIFVPILNKSHWWCIGVSINTESVWVIDSLSLRRQGVRDKLLLKKMLAGVELFLETLSPDHKRGTILTWPLKPVQMECQSDSNSCGVRMLLAIKACAERFHPEFVLRSPIEEERQWLLNDDVMHPLNEVKDEVRKAIENYRNQVS